MREGVVLEHDWWPRPLPTNVSIGRDCWIHSSFAFLHFASLKPTGVKIGHDTGVYIGTLFDLGPDGEVVIGDYATIAGPIISTDHRVEIGSYAFISYKVVIADSFAALPPDVRDAGLRRHPAAAPSDIHIGENAWIGARSVILGGSRIGKGAIIGAATVVDFEVPPFAIVAGSPARVVGWARPRVDHTRDAAP